MERNKRMIGVFLIGMIAACICMGCGNEPEEPVEQPSTQASVVSMESTPVIHYTVPQVVPNIFVNQVGYSPESEKEIPLRGKELPKEFTMIDAATGEEVFRGNIGTLTYNEEMNIYTGLANVSDFTKEGTYYLKCDKIGYSLSFNIEDDIYKQMLSEVYQKMMESCREDTAALSDVMTLLTAYEWYPGVFPDEDGDEIPDAMSTIADWIRRREQAERDEKHETLYVAVLAKFSYLYQKYDWQYATECLQHASAVFAKNQPHLGQDADNFYALTELYRATGLHTYRTQIKDYKSFFEGNSSYLGETSYMYGAMTYLVTRQRVDVDLCRTFMEDIMDRGEEVSNRYEEMLSPIAAKNNGIKDLMERVSILICCNYVLNNYEYTHIIEEFQHYFCGRNSESKCFFPEEGNIGGYLLLLTQLVATEDMR